MGIIARQAVWNTVFTYLGIALGFVNVVLLYPRVLASDEFGLTRLLLSVATIVAQVAQFGAENTVVRYFPYFRDPERSHRGLLSMLLLFGAVVGGIAALLLALFHGVLADVFSDRNALYGRFGLFVLPLVLSEVYFILLRSYSRSLRRTVQPTVIREFQLRVLQAVLILLQLWWSMPFALFTALYVGTFLACTASLAVDLYRAGAWSPGWRERWLPRRLRKSMVTYSAYTLSGTVAGMALGNLDQLMIGALLGDGLRYVAHYAVAFYFGSVIATPARALNQVAVPLIADAWKRQDLPMIQDLYARSSLVQTALSGFLLVMLWACIDPLYHLLPEEYAYASGVAVLIGAGYFLSSVLGLSIGIIAMSRSFRMDAWTSIVLLAINVVGNFILIRSHGIMGAAWATLLSLVLVNIYRTWYLRARFGLWPFGLRSLAVFGLLVVTGVLVALLPVIDGRWADIFLRGTVGTAVFWGGCLLFRLVPELTAMLHGRGLGRGVFRP